jgi:hypothetical protein
MRLYPVRIIEIPCALETPNLSVAGGAAEAHSVVPKASQELNHDFIAIGDRVEHPIKFADLTFSQNNFQTVGIMTRRPAKI